METRNPNLSEQELKHATSPAGLSVSKVLYRGYPTASISAETPILTAAGFKPAGELTIDDIIISGTGEPAKISAIMKNPPEPVYRVNMKSGRAVVTSADGLWSLWETASKDIRRVTTTRDIYERTQRHIQNNINAPLMLAMPINGPAETDNGTAIDIRKLKQLALAGFPEPMPSEWLFASVHERTQILAFFATYFGKYEHNWTIPLQTTWNPEIHAQLLGIIRSLGLNVRMQEKSMRICTYKNLTNFNGLPLRIPKPMDFRDDILSAELLPELQPTICIAPEPHIQNYIVQDFCVVHTTLYSYDFDSKLPCMPWGTPQNQQVPLRYLYKSFETKKPQKKSLTTKESKPAPGAKPKRRSIVKKKKR